MHMYMFVGFTGIAEKNVPQLLTLSLKGHCLHVLHQRGPITLLNTVLKIQTCNERGWSCISLVVEAYGGWGQEAVSMFARLSILLSLHQRQSFSAALNELYCHLSVVLMRQNAQALLAHAAGAR